MGGVGRGARSCGGRAQWLLRRNLHGVRGLQLAVEGVVGAHSSGGRQRVLFGVASLRVSCSSGGW